MNFALKYFICIYYFFAPAILSKRIYILAKNETQPLSPAYKVTPFYLGVNDVILFGPKGRRLSIEERKDVDKIVFSGNGFTSINELFLGWKTALLTGYRQPINTSELVGSLGEYGVQERSIRYCRNENGRIVRCPQDDNKQTVHNWPLWNANKDNIIYQGVRRIIESGENLNVTTALLNGNMEDIFGFIQNEGPNPHWGLGWTTEEYAKTGNRFLRWNSGNTYGHILKSLRNAYSVDENIWKLKAFFVGPKTEDEDMKLWDVADELPIEAAARYFDISNLV